MKTFKSVSVLVFILFCSVAINPLHAQRYTISTIAGSGNIGHGGDGGFSADAELDMPCSVALDSFGNIYIADDGPSTNCIRKINTSGIISTIIGGRSDDYPPDDDVVIQEQTYPTAIASDAQGNIYIADKTNNRIQRISKYGTISIIAGNGIAGHTGDSGQATSAELKNPTGIAIDHRGNIYIADLGNNCIRKINAKGIITTVAGTDTSGHIIPVKLNYPVSVAVDIKGNLYIADEGNNCIQKIDRKGRITTVAGNGKQGYSGDGGLATNAELGRPTGVAVDNTGNIYIADWFNNRIRKVDTSGIISTFAGDGIAGYCGDGEDSKKAELITPYTVSNDALGNVYIVDYGNHRIRKVNSKGIISTIAGNGVQNYFGDGGPATNAELNSPSGVAVGKNGVIYCADKSGNFIHKIDTNGIISIIAGNGAKGFSGDGRSSVNAQFNSPSLLSIDSIANLYIADLGNQRIREINNKGIISTMAGCGVIGFSGDGSRATDAKMNAPYNITLNSKGDMFIADFGNQRIRKVDKNGIISTIAGNGTIGYTGDGGPAINAQLNYPSDAITDSFGNIYISDESNNCIRKINSAGIISTIAGNGTAGYSGDSGKAISAQLAGPIGLVLDNNGNLFVADNGNNCIRMITTDRYIFTIAGDGNEGHCGNGGDAINAELNSPYGLAIDSNGNIYVADYANNEIRKLTPIKK